LTGKIAIVSALHREVAGLVKNWKVTSEQGLRFFQNGQLVLVCGGIGAQAARRATEGVVNFCKPELIVSVGFAGALMADLKVGDLLTPRWVIDAKDGSRHDTGAGEGALLTIHEVAGVDRKAKLAAAYGAQAVDMEAAGVARGAETHGIRFLAIKVISDELDFSMPPVDRFVDSAGQFKTGGFAAYTGLRPWLWKSVFQLGRNSAVASRVLRKTLEQESILAIAASNRSNP
jgi:adenosylhomocysteine nucleosidase